MGWSGSSSYSYIDCAEAMLLVFVVVVLTLHVHDSLSSSLERAAAPCSDSFVGGLEMLVL
jgi:hypothetical protein